MPRKKGTKALRYTQVQKNQENDSGNPGMITTTTIAEKTTTEDDLTTNTIEPTVVKRKLDKSRSYGVNMGPSKNGAKYVQDGFSFNAQGELIE